MVHVETQPLSQALHHVDAAVTRWVRVLNDARWARVRNSEASLPRTLRFSEPISNPVKLRLKGDEAQLLVVLDEEQWPSLRLIKQIPDQLRKDAVLNLCAYQALRQLCDMGCKVERCYWDSEAQLPVSSRVSVQLNGCLVDLYPESASDRFLDGVQAFLKNHTVPMTTRLAQWPLSTAVALGERAFSLSRIKALKVGDWVLWGSSAYVTLRIHGAVANETSDLVATCQLSKRELTVEEALHEESQMVATEAEDAESLHSSYAGLQVNVRFEIDGPAMTVAQAVGLTPGEVIVLAAPVDQARVRLRCQGRCFAYGELVNVGGQMGVRIVEVGGADV